VKSSASSLPTPIVALIIFAVCTFVGVARYTTLLDPAGGGRLPSALLLHPSAAPCLRYPSAPPASSVKEAAGALAAVELSDVSDLAGDLHARAARSEASLHPRSEVEEHLAQMFEDVPLQGRLVLTLKRDLMRAQLTELLTMALPVTRTIASLPEAQRVVFEQQWARDPQVFVLPGLLVLTRELHLAVTERRLDAVLATLQQQISRGEVPHLAGEEDDWGSPLVLERASADELTLSSLGADRTTGGTGFDADLVRALKVAPPTPGPACEGKMEISLQRSEFKRVLAEISALSASARIVPALHDGVEIGLRMLRLSAGSFLVKAGLCEGDLVISLNGSPLTSADNMLEVYSALQKAKQVIVELYRAGELVTLVVQLA
jgi:hypothetical protein